MACMCGDSECRSCGGAQGTREGRKVNITPREALKRIARTTHHVELDGKGTHSADCPPCLAKAALEPTQEPALCMKDSGCDGVHNHPGECFPKGCLTGNPVGRPWRPGDKH